MGRHSRGAGQPPAPLPDPPARHPYAPRSTEDTGVWDHSTYRVVDVGLPGDSPAAGPRAVPEPAPRRPDPPRYGATRSDLATPTSRFRPHPTDPPSASRLAPPPDSRLLPPAEPRFGAGRADAPEPRFGATPSESRPAAPPEVRLGGPSESRFGATRADLAESRFPAPSESRFGATRADPAESRFPAPSESRIAAPGEARSGERVGGPGEFRFGATRADLVGSTALAPRPAPDPDEVTDTGARRARSAFRLAESTEPTVEETDEDEREDDYDDDHEPSLLLQWGIFVAQTLTGAVAGLGVWLGFYRLWSTWPFYAVPAAGVVAIAMLVLARTLRRRHGRDLDLLTAIVTVGVGTVLTVLPAAFTLQGLTQ